MLLRVIPQMGHVGRIIAAVALTLALLAGATWSGALGWPATPSSYGVHFKVSGMPKSQRVGQTAQLSLTVLNTKY